MTDRPPALLRAVFCSGAACAAAMAALALQPLTTLTVIWLSDEQNQATQSATSVPGLPVPHRLVWGPALGHFVDQFGRMPSAAVLAYEIALLLVVAYVALRALNPTFRLTTGVDWDATVLTRTYMHSRPLIKAFLVAVTAAVPGGLLWYLLTLLLGDGVVAFTIRAMAIGAIVWFLFSRNGVAGNYESGNYDLPRERPVLLSLAGRGAAMGAVAAISLRLAPYQQPTGLFQFYRSLGGIGPGEWLAIAGIVVGFAAGLGFAGGGLCVALGRPGIGLARRCSLGVLPLAAMAAVLLGGRAALPAWVRARFDFDPSTAVPPGRRLAAAAGIGATLPSSQSILVVGPERALGVPAGNRSIVGVDTSAPSALKIARFLERRNYVTALSDPAFKTLFDAACLEWDSDRVLQVCLLNLTRCPEPVYQTLAAEKLSGCAATDAARKHLDAFADARHFAFPDRRSRAFVGDLYARFGDKATAEKWYVRAGVAPTRIAERLAQRALFTDGVVTGRLLLNGRPAGGVKVGLVPRTGIERVEEMALPDGSLRPFWLRWVAARATTDGQGRFTFRRVLSGGYRLVVSLPGLPDAVQAFQVRGDAANLREIRIAFASKAVSLGDVALSPIGRPQPVRPLTTAPLRSL